MIKIFGLPSHATKVRTAGVDFARIIQPLKALGQVKGFETFVYDPNKEMHNDPVEWLPVAKKYDIVYLNYIVNPWGYAAMGAMVRGQGKKIVLDLDDSLWDIRPDNPAADAYKKGGEEINNLTCICNDVDLITCTSNYLKNVIMSHTDKTADKIKVLDNFVDLNIYSKKPKFKNTPGIRITHHGSTTHFEDLTNPEFMSGINKIMDEFPNVTLEFIGAFIPKFKERWGQRYINSYGNEDFYKWSTGRFPELIKEADIVIAPLRDNVYTRCKSGIKYLENGAMGKPGVYQDMPQYQKYIKQGVNGYLAFSAEDWYKSLKELIVSVEKRKSVGEEAYKTIQDYTIQKNVKYYAKMFKEVLDK